MFKNIWLPELRVKYQRSRQSCKSSTKGAKLVSTSVQNQPNGTPPPIPIISGITLFWGDCGALLSLPRLFSLCENIGFDSSVLRALADFGDLPLECEKLSGIFGYSY